MILTSTFLTDPPCDRQTDGQKRTGDSIGYSARCIYMLSCTKNVRSMKDTSVISVMKFI